MDIRSKRACGFADFRAVRTVENEALSCGVLLSRARCVPARLLLILPLLVP